METGLFKEKQRISNTCATVLLILGPLLLAGVFIHPALVLLWGFGVFFLAIGLFWLSSNRRAKKNMEAFGVDDAAIQQAEQEMRGAWTWRYQNIILTSNWMMDKSMIPGKPVLYPLRAVAAFTKEYTRSRSGRRIFYVRITLSNGAVHKLPYFPSPQQPDEITALLARFCPWANARPMPMPPPQ